MRFEHCELCQAFMMSADVVTDCGGRRICRGCHEEREEDMAISLAVFGTDRPTEDA